MRRMAVFLMLISAGMMVLSGCEKTVEDVKKKFVRKKKGRTHQPVYFYDEKYVPEYPNATLYKNHYIYWKRWEEELVEALKGSNYVKQTGYAQHGLSELKSMQSYLVGKKQEDLGKYVKQLENILADLKKGKGGSSPARKTIMSDTEMHLYRVMRRFSPKEVSDYIKEDEIQPLEDEDDQEKEEVAAVK